MTERSGPDCTTSDVCPALHHTTECFLGQFGDIDLDAIDARANAATSGPWYQGRDYRGYESAGEAWTRKDSSDPDSGDLYPHWNREADAEFIAHARTDVPAMSKRIRKLEAEVERMSQRVGELEATVRWKQGLIEDIAASCEQAEAEVERLSQRPSVEKVHRVMSDGAATGRHSYRDISRAVLALFPTVEGGGTP